MCVCVCPCPLCKGSESLQLAKATQLQGLLTQQIHQLDAAEGRLTAKREENAKRLLQQYKVAGEGVLGRYIGAPACASLDPGPIYMYVYIHVHDIVHAQYIYNVHVVVHIYMYT